MENEDVMCLFGIVDCMSLYSLEVI